MVHLWSIFQCFSWFLKIFARFWVVFLGETYVLVPNPEALMLLTLAEMKFNDSKDAREEAVHLAAAARQAFGKLQDRKMEGESCLAP